MRVESYGEELAIEIKRILGAGVKFSRAAHQQHCHLCEQSGAAMLVCVGEAGARDIAANARMIKQAAPGVQTRLYVAQAFAKGGRTIGRITSDGRVWNDGYGGCTVGHVSSDGRVWNDGYGGRSIGRVTPDGRVWSDGYGGGSIGRVTDGDILAGGAALLLLLRR